MIGIQSAFIILSISFLASYLLIKYVQDPIDKLRRRRLKNNPQ